MNNSKTTRRALTASILSIFLCLMLLLGSTFAWFTDSVTSGNNRIVAGNLDINLAYTTNGTNWTDVDSNTSLFSGDTLWEPGHVEVAYLKIENLGSLALQYQLGITATDTVVSTNIGGEELRLSEHLHYAVVDMNATNGNITTYGDRDAAMAAVPPGSPLLSQSYNYSGTLYPDSADDNTYPTERYIALIVYMPEDAGNAANYKTGEPAPEITLGVTLNATQAPYESDSFDANYDSEATFEVSSESELRNALSTAEPGSIIMLKNDITVTGDGILNLNTENVTLDLQGKTLDISAINIYRGTGEDEIIIQNGVIVGSKSNDYGYNPVEVYGADQNGSTKVFLRNVEVIASEQTEYAMNFYWSDVTLENVTVNGRVNFIEGKGTINGGNFTARTNDKFIIDSNFGLTVNGGTFTVTGENQTIFNVSEPSAEASFTINNGTFNYHGESYPIHNVNISYPATYIHIKGGTFNGTPYVDTMYDNLVRK